MWIFNMMLLNLNIIWRDKLNLIKKTLLLTASCFALAFTLFSCASLPESTFPPEGVYSYDFERYVDCVEITAMYKSYGMDAYQNILKKSYGNAVLMQGGTFVEPETRILISISPNGEVSSPQNPTISGKYKKNGDLFFQGYYEENSQISKITISAKLLPSREYERASTDFDGDFILVDNGTGRKQKVKIENGLYLWEYDEKQKDDFETWPVIVSSDGTIQCGFDMTVRSGVKNMTNMLVSSLNKTHGKVSKDGKILVQTITKNYGTGQNGEENIVDFSGVRGTENLVQISKEKAEESKIQNKLTKARVNRQIEKKENPPEWYSDFIHNDSEFLYGSARKTHADKATALKIAELTAVSQIKSSLVQNIVTKTEAEKNMSQENNGETKNESKFFRAVETFSDIQIPYEVKNSFYDEKTNTAYVVVRLSRTEADKINNL